MKTLYLVRHAKSSWKEPDLRDYDRPLNHRGERDAPFMGNLMFERNILPDIIMSSGANRAITTAKIIAETINFPLQNIVKKDAIYESGVGQLLDIINAIDDSNDSAMLFGHNPGFTMLSNYLSGKRIDNLPTCSYVKIEFEADSWKNIEIGSGKLIEFEYPKKYLK